MKVPSSLVPFVDSSRLELQAVQSRDVQGDPEDLATHVSPEIPEARDFPEDLPLLGFPEHLTSLANLLHQRDQMSREGQGDLASLGDPPDLEAPGVQAVLGLLSHLIKIHELCNLFNPQIKH